MKKISIGEKVKQERGEEKQSNIMPDNQGQLSQIESGKIKNPKKHTLMEIVKGLNDMGNPVTFEELIEGTTWEESKGGDIATEVALSPSLLDMRLTDDGVLTINHRSYPLYNKEGDRNEFCPETGEKLIYKCESCGRRVENAEQKFCMGCGEEYFESIDIPKVVKEEIDFPLNYIQEGDAFNGIDHLSRFLMNFKEDTQKLMEKEDRKKPTIRERQTLQIVEFVLNYFKKKFIDEENRRDSKVTTYESIKTELFRQAAIKITEKMDTDELSLEKLLNIAKDLGKADDLTEIVKQLDSKSLDNENKSGHGNPESVLENKSDAEQNDAINNKETKKGDKNV